MAPGNCSRRCPAVAGACGSVRSSVWGGLPGLVAAVALGTGLWRSGSFGKGMAIAFGLAFALSIVSAPIFSIVGALMLIVVGIVIARSG